MLYSVVDKDKNIVHGPMQWSRNSFTRHFFVNGLNEVMPVNPPTETVVVGEYKIMLVEDPFTPELDLPYEQLAGPYWTVTNDKVIGYYDKAPVEINSAKGKLKEQATAARYEKEISGVNYELNGETVRLDTARGARETLIMKHAAATTGSTYSFKFNVGFRDVTKTQLQSLLKAVSDHIQSAFDWEKQKHDAIDAASTVEELKAVQVQMNEETAPAQVNPTLPVISQ